jgi:2-haloacid dehalogenase
MTQDDDPGIEESGRRAFLLGGVAGLALAGLVSAPAAAQQQCAPATVPGVEALVFDVFGTCVDWRGSIIREGQAFGLQRGLTVDWVNFADDWRDGYKPAMQKVRSGQIPWMNIDGLHRMILDGLLEKYGIKGLSEADIDHLNRAWHRLSPWSDTVVGLHRLKGHFIIATLSNGNVSLLVDMAKNAGLPWDTVLSAELTGHYKPDPEVYQTAARLLGRPPEKVMMVAAHKGDLIAAKAVGLRTALVPRPLEHGPGRAEDVSPDPRIDVYGTDFVDLAIKLGA